MSYWIAIKGRTQIRSLKLSEHKGNNSKIINKVLNKADIFVLAYGAMIGWAWVVMSGKWIMKAGTLGAILAFIAGGIVVMFVGQVYAELTSAMSNGKGVLDFTLRGVGRRFAFIATWTLLLGYFSVIAFEAVALPNVMTHLFPDYLKIKMYSVAGFDVHLTWMAVGIGSSVVIAFINYIGVKIAAAAQTVLTIVVAIAGVGLIFGGFINGNVQNLEPLFENGISGFIAVAAMTPFMYVGFDVIPSASSEANIPQKKIGKILLLAVFIAVVWYVLIIFSVSVGLSKLELASSSIATADAMKNLYSGSTVASKILICGGIAGILTCWNSFYIGGSRMILYMANEGMLPKFLGKTHPKYKTPSNAIILIAVLTSVAPFLGGNMLTWLVNAGGLAMNVTYLLVSIAFLMLRKKEPEMLRPYKIKRWRFIGIGSIVLCFGLSMMYMPHMPSALTWPYEWAIVLIWVLLGIVLYFGAKKGTKDTLI